VADLLLWSLLALLWFAMVSALVSALRVPGYVWKGAHRSKAGNVVLVALTGGIGGTYYWLRVRPQLADARQATPAPPRPPRPDPWADGGAW
jgi:hypothetical protein